MRTRVISLLILLIVMGSVVWSPAVFDEVSYAEGGISPYYAYTHSVAAGLDITASGVAECYGKIVVYDHCQTSHTVALEDGTYCYCTLDSKKPYRAYLPEAVEAQEAAKIRRSIQEDADTLGKLFISTVPWVSYTALVQPVPSPADSNPRITWGKYFTQEGRTLLPLSVLCHHALVDGIHIAAFYRGLDEEIENFVRSEGDDVV